MVEARAVGALARGARLEIQLRHVRSCTQADAAYGARVAAALGKSADQKES